MVKKWSLGFMISTEAVPGGRGPGSLAWAGLGNTYFWIDTARGVAGVILMQLIPFADPTALALLAGFEHALYAALGQPGIIGLRELARADSPPPDAFRF